MSNGFGLKSTSATGDSLKFILDLLDRQQSAKFQEANQWGDNLNAAMALINSASNSDDLSDFDSIMGEWIDKGEDYSSMTGNPAYEMLGKVAASEYGNKKRKIEAFEGALGNFADSKNSSYIWNIEKFKVPEKGPFAFKEGEDLKNAWTNFMGELGDKPLTFPSDISTSEVALFSNMWSDAVIKGWVPRDKSLPNIMFDLKNQYQSKMNALQGMGLQFDEYGNITNLYDLGNIKKTYGADNYNIEELAREMHNSFNVYNNFEYALTNQDTGVNLIQKRWNAETGEIETVEGSPLQVKQLSPSEARWIFDATDLRDFKNKEAEVVKNLESDLKTYHTQQNQLNSNMSSLFNTLKNLRAQDLKFQELDEMSEEAKEVMLGSEYVPSDGNFSYNQIANNLNSLINEYNNIEQKITTTNLNAITWGAYDEIAAQAMYDIFPEEGGNDLITSSLGAMEKFNNSSRQIDDLSKNEIMFIQEDLGLEEKYIDGVWGERTNKAFNEKVGGNFNSIGVDELKNNLDQNQFMLFLNALDEPQRNDLMNGQEIDRKFYDKFIEIAK